jgi:hypothetical protein
LFLKNAIDSHVWWSTSVISALGKLRQEDRSAVLLDFVHGVMCIDTQEISEQNTVVKHWSLTMFSLSINFFDLSF